MAEIKVEYNEAELDELFDNLDEDSTRQELKAELEKKLNHKTHKTNYVSKIQETNLKKIGVYEISTDKRRGVKEIKKDEIFDSGEFF